MSPELITEAAVWIRSADAMVIAAGAGKAVPTVRLHTESLGNHLAARLIRINLREAQVPTGQIGLPCGALAGLTAIQKAL